jgi:uncharacterized protein YjbI with pentapeptide repeats
MAKPPSSKAKNRKPATAAEPAPAEPPIAFDAEGLKRVQDIIKNARATWFALLGALVIASITLASVKDVSFFVNSVETKLPLVGISVPVTSFFWAGSLLIAAIYAYFHLYLELLWQALGDAPSRIDGKPLADRIDPWIVADSALRLRDRLRGAHGEERASRKRAMQLVSDVVSVGLVWVFGLVVIFWFWWRSMPAHQPVLTGFIGVVLAGTLWVFCMSVAAAFAHLAEIDAKWRWKPFFTVTLFAVLGLTVVRTWIDPWGGSVREEVLGYKIVGQKRKTDSPIEFLRPVRADLRETVFTEKPNDWSGREIAKTEFRVRWCKERPELQCANPLVVERDGLATQDDEAFREAWAQRWRALLAQLPKPDLRGADLRGAHLAQAELEGIKLLKARLDGAKLSDAHLEGADLGWASLEGATLNGSTLDGASFAFAKMERARLAFASLVGANFTLARLEQAEFQSANLSDADFNMADLTGAHFWYANLTNANFNGANFLNAHIGNANLKRANLTSARLFGMKGLPLDFSKAELSQTVFRGAAFRYANLNSPFFRDIRILESSFGDASVTLPENVSAPCQWGSTELPDSEYYGRWKGWLEVLNEDAHLMSLIKATAILPPPGCIPKTASP